jgi:hypothetical protein
MNTDESSAEHFTKLLQRASEGRKEPRPLDMRPHSPDMNQLEKALAEHREKNGNNKLDSLARGILGCTYGELMDLSEQLKISKGDKPLDDAEHFAALLHRWAKTIDAASA